MKQNSLLYILLFFSVLSLNGQNQNLDKLSAGNRNKILKETAKEVILKYGPGYYREKGKPVILLNIIDDDGIYGKTDRGRKYYSVYYPYDSKKEKLNMEYTADVQIWADTGIAFRVFFGNGFGFYDLDKTEHDGQIPYQAYYEKEESEAEMYRKWLWSYNEERKNQTFRLDSLSKKDRDKILIEIAEDVIFSHGNDYYRQYKKPIIKKHVITGKDDVHYNSEIGRTYYFISFPYNRKKERLRLQDAARVLIWADTAEPFSVIFGNGRILYDLDKEKSEEFVPYESLPPK